MNESEKSPDFGRTTVFHRSELPNFSSVAGTETFAVGCAKA